VRISLREYALPCVIAVPRRIVRGGEGVQLKFGGTQAYMPVHIMHETGLIPEQL
jgi:hypothetical protein